MPKEALMKLINLFFHFSNNCSHWAPVSRCKSGASLGFKFSCIFHLLCKNFPNVLQMLAQDCLGAIYAFSCNSFFFSHQIHKSLGIVGWFFPIVLLFISHTSCLKSTISVSSSWSTWFFDLSG